MCGAWGHTRKQRGKIFRAAKPEKFTGQNKTTHNGARGRKKNWCGAFCRPHKKQHKGIRENKNKNKRKHTKKKETQRFLHKKTRVNTPKIKKESPFKGYANPCGGVCPILRISRFTFPSCDQKLINFLLHYWICLPFHRPSRIQVRSGQTNHRLSEPFFPRSLLICFTCCFCFLGHLSLCDLSTSDSSRTHAWDLRSDRWGFSFLVLISLVRDEMVLSSLKIGCNSRPSNGVWVRSMLRHFLVSRLMIWGSFCQRTPIPLSLTLCQKDTLSCFAWRTPAFSANRW